VATNGLKEGVEIQRFRKVFVEAAFRGALPVALLRVARNADETCVREGRFGTQLTGDFIAIEAGQTEIYCRRVPRRSTG